MKRLLLPILAWACLGSTGPAHAAITGHWNFSKGDLASTIGQPLAYLGTTAASTSFGTTASFGIPGIQNQVVPVMKFPACAPGEGFIMTHGANPNGSGGRVNRYTLILDVLFPATSTGFGSFWQTDPGDISDGELFVNGSQGIGISGQYQGNLSPGEWHRVAFTIDLTTRELGKFIDGTNVLSGPTGLAPLGSNPMQYLGSGSGDVDQRWSLGPTALLFADEDHETRSGYVRSVQFRDTVLSPAEIASLGAPQPGGIPTNEPPVVLPGSVAQCDLNGNLNSSVGGSPLVADFAAPATAAGLTFATTTIGGQAAQIAELTRGTFLRWSHGLGSNGGGSRLNQYTLILDVNFPTRDSGWSVFYQTNPNNSDDGEWFVNPAGGVGISGVYGGAVPINAWNRCAVVVDLVGGTFTSFINGARVQQITGQVLDGRWALGPEVLLFADENEENSPVWVNSVQLVPFALPEVDVAALGEPGADGVPLPATPTLNLTAPNGGEVWTAGTTQTIAWSTQHPAGFVRVDLYRNGIFLNSLGSAPMAARSFTWAISPTVGDTNTYRIRLTASIAATLTDDSDANFSIAGSTGGNPMFGVPLLANGGFEALFEQWATVEGQPLVLTATDGKGSPHGGARFWHGGMNTTASQAVARQEIDLLAAGFSPSDLDHGAGVEAEAWLRNEYGAGNFDDQVYLRVGCLDAGRQELSSLRCLVAANNLWLQRQLLGLLPPGTRFLRTEIVGRHRRDLDNDSMADDVALRLVQPYPITQPNITKLPMLQDVRTNAMTLLWETDGNLVAHAVDWGRGAVTEHTLTDIETLQIDATHFVHRATLTGLEAESSYVYRVRSGVAQTPAYRFTTAPKPSSPFIVAWWGDNHNGTVTLATHVTNLLSQGPNMICVAGDMVNSGNSLLEWHDYWFKPLETLNAAQTTPVMFARGNHDGEHALAYAYSALPGNEAWFAFNYGNSRFIFLDSEVSTGTEISQFNWLKAELQRPETQAAAFRVVCFHRPPFTDFWNGGGYTGETFARTDWVPLFEQQHVDFVIGGHMHAYQRGLTNGVTYVVSGGGGGYLDTERVANWPFVAAEFSQYHYGLMTVHDLTMSWEVYDVENQPLDAFTLPSRRPNIKELTLRNADVRLVVSGKPGTTYVTEASEDLEIWTPIQTNALPGTATTFTNVFSLGSGTRFFRPRTAP